jgi:hypothetical protein
VVEGPGLGLSPNQSDPLHDDRLVLAAVNGKSVIADC